MALLFIAAAILHASVQGGRTAAPARPVQPQVLQPIVPPISSPIVASEPPPTVTPTAPSTQTPSASESGTATLFDLLVQPLSQEAQRRRSQRAEGDPQWNERVDLALNRGRVNILLFGYGYPENYHPGSGAFGYEGSPTIISLDLLKRTADLVSLTHDIRAPEIEREVAKPGQKVTAIKLDQAYAIGKFDLMGRTLEDATGLSVDFQIAFNETMIRDLVDQVFGGVAVDIPRAFAGIPVYIDGVGYPARFEKGPQRLTGTQVVIFIKTTPVVRAGRYYGKDLEHNVRKALVVEALLQAWKEKSVDSGFWANLVWFILAEQARLGDRRIDYDFDPMALAVGNIQTLLPHLGEINRVGEIGFPEIRRKIYIQDPANGDGGVGWVARLAFLDSRVRRDVELGVYPPSGVGFAAPIGGNPYGEDLVLSYWPSVRDLVKQTLTTEKMIKPDVYY
jgi:cell envelope-related transcriptional attenuator-like protein